MLYFSACLAAANSEAQSLRESLGVRAAYILWIVRGCSPPPPPPILRTWVQKSTLLLQNRGHAEVLKRPLLPRNQSFYLQIHPPAYIHIYIHTHIHTYVCTYIQIYTHIYKMCVCVRVISKKWWHCTWSMIKLSQIFSINVFIYKTSSKKICKNV